MNAQARPVIPVEYPSRIVFHGGFYEVINWKENRHESNFKLEGKLTENERASERYIHSLIELCRLPLSDISIIGLHCT